MVGSSPRQAERPLFVLPAPERTVRFRPQTLSSNLSKSAIEQPGTRPAAPTRIEGYSAGRYDGQRTKSRSGPAMSTISKTKVSLRFQGDLLQPEDLSRDLGCAPNLAAAKGHPWHTPQGTARIARTGMWHKRVEACSSGDIDGQVSELLSLMTSDLAVWKRLTTDFQADVFCGLFLDEMNQGIELGRTTLQTLAARGLLIGLDVYGAGEEQQFHDGGGMRP